jgi:hypothetical protein
MVTSSRTAAALREGNPRTLAPCATLIHKQCGHPGFTIAVGIIRCQTALTGLRLCPNDVTDQAAFGFSVMFTNPNRDSTQRLNACPGCLAGVRRRRCFSRRAAPVSPSQGVPDQPSIILTRATLPPPRTARDHSLGRHREQGTCDGCRPGRLLPTQPRQESACASAAARRLHHLLRAAGADASR